MSQTEETTTKQKFVDFHWQSCEYLDGLEMAEHDDAIVIHEFPRLPSSSSTTTREEFSYLG